MSLKVFNKSCQNCLLSKDRIVSPERAKEIIEECKKKQKHFICHKSDDVVCRTFYDKLGHYSQGIRIAERLDMIKFVDYTDNKKLKPYSNTK